MSITLIYTQQNKEVTTMSYYRFYISGKDPDAPEPRIMGECMNCKEELREDYSYFTDDYENTFCCRDCALEFYNLRETEWPEDYD